MWLRDFKRHNGRPAPAEDDDVSEEAQQPQPEALTLTAEEQARLTERLKELQAEPMVPVTRISPGEYTEERIHQLLAKARWTSAGAPR